MNQINLDHTKTIRAGSKRVDASGVVFFTQAARSMFQPILPKAYPVSMLTSEQLEAAGFSRVVGDNYPLIVALNTVNATAQRMKSRVESNESWYLTPVIDSDGVIYNLWIGQHVSSPRGWAGGVFGQHLRQSFAPSLRPIRANGIGGGRVNTEPFSAGPTGSSVGGQFNQRIDLIEADARVTMYTLLNLPLIAESWFGTTYRQPWAIAPTTETSHKVKGTLSLNFLRIRLAEVSVSGFTMDARGILGKPVTLHETNQSAFTLWYGANQHNAI